MRKVWIYRLRVARENIRHLFPMHYLNTNLHKCPNIHHTTPIYFFYFTAPLFYIFLFAHCVLLLLHVYVLLCHLVLWPQDWINSTTVCFAFFVILCVCVFVWLRISSPRIKLFAWNFARWFIGVLGRESHVLGHFAPQKPKIEWIGCNVMLLGFCDSHASGLLGVWTLDRHVWIYGRPRGWTYLFHLCMVFHNL